MSYFTLTYNTISLEIKLKICNKCKNTLKVIIESNKELLEEFDNIILKQNNETLNYDFNMNSNGNFYCDIPKEIIQDKIEIYAQLKDTIGNLSNVINSEMTYINKNNLFLFKILPEQLLYNIKITEPIGRGDVLLYDHIEVSCK